MSRKPEAIETINKKLAHLNINLIMYKGADHECIYICKHGEKKTRGWSLLKAKHCCREGFYESKKMWEKNTKSLEQLKQQAIKDRKNIDLTNAFIDNSGKYKKLSNILCTVHNEYYSSITGKKIGLCPLCNYERNITQLKKAAPQAWQKVKDGVFVSRSEIKWLDELGVVNRQVWLEDVRYKVDGYDPITKTVYLYHGKFWHGCPETYDPEEIHPIVKVKMKDLYEKTLEYENKILQAGYTLVTKWGT